MHHVRAIFYVILACGLLYEGWAAFTNSPDSISEIVWGWCRNYPLIILIAGIVIGHLFAQDKSIYAKKDAPKT